MSTQTDVEQWLQDLHKRLIDHEMTDGMIIMLWAQASNIASKHGLIINVETETWKMIVSRQGEIISPKLRTIVEVVEFVDDYDEKSNPTASTDA